MQIISFFSQQWNEIYTTSEKKMSKPRREKILYFLSYIFTTKGEILPFILPRIIWANFASPLHPRRYTRQKR